MGATVHLALAVLRIRRSCRVRGMGEQSRLLPGP
jgi:hypothetical protein